MIDANDVKQLRKSLGLSQSQFAAILNLSTDTIQRWEQGYKYNPTRRTRTNLEKIKSRRESGKEPEGMER